MFVEVVGSQLHDAGSRRSSTVTEASAKRERPEVLEADAQQVEHQQPQDPVVGDDDGPGRTALPLKVRS